MKEWMEESVWQGDSALPPPKTAGRKDCGVAHFQGPFEGRRRGFERRRKWRRSSQTLGDQPLGELVASPRWPELRGWDPQAPSDRLGEKFEDFHRRGLELEVSGEKESKWAEGNGESRYHFGSTRFEDCRRRKRIRGRGDSEHAEELSGEFGQFWNPPKTKIRTKISNISDKCTSEPWI